ncbi:unannotated protein [freshwater metagenome]|uniref:Unannotated protein n=1 Tax=freshwater metagenome TaxID=449393 RepID=A0A6J7J7Y1_9ZZZZ|nr:hypothetical protein [Actinomycetota bacterium]
MRIAIDIDSTLHHYWDQFSHAVREQFGIDMPYEGQTSWGITRLELDQIKAAVLYTHSDEVVAAAEPYDGAVDVVNSWHEAGHYIHITSHRSDTAFDATTRWLEAIGLRYDDLHCSFDKLTRCRELGMELLVDDSPVNLEGALELGMMGATIIHPWNRELVASGRVIGAAAWPELGLALAPLLHRAA